MNVPDKLISLCSWEEVCIYIFYKKNKIPPSVRDIASEFNLPRMNVFRKVKHLQDLGFLGTANGTELGTQKKTIEERKRAFEHSLASYVTSGQYDAKMVRAFSDYWTEYNKTKTKMRWEYEKTWETSKRLSTWASRNKQKFQSEKNNTDIGVILHDSKNKDYKKGSW